MLKTHSISENQEEEPDICSFPYNLIAANKALRFGIDAFLLSSYANQCLEERFHSYKKVPFLVELGCADGVALLGLLIKWKQAQALGIDFNADFIALAKKNANRFSLSPHFLTLDVRKVTDDPSLKKYREQADLVLANPPWRRSSEGRRSSNKMRELALWADKDTFSVFAKAATFFLRHGGQFCSIIHPSALPLLLMEMEKNRLGIREIMPLFAHKDQKALRLLLRAQKNAKALPIFLPPLILHKENSAEFSDAALAFCPWLERTEGLKSKSSEKI